MLETPSSPDKDSQAPPAGEKHRSIADGQLSDAWSLKDYFRSLNSVMRLPAKSRWRIRKAEVEAAKAAARWKLPAFKGVRLPRPVVLGSFAMLAVVLVIRPLMLSASRSSGDRLIPALGVWQAKAGKYAGRMFEVTRNSVAFYTSSTSPDYTWHRIEDVQVRATSDSTLYTVIYEVGGKTAHFSFWF
ncbi:MAG TPA: hypothetical protein VNH46_04955, partial [Gemmatimonadales bacterium]|nr:hypothetical protein [Gemmatimonadales bacterium]